MITIQIVGLDHFVVGQYSRENSSNIAQLFETGEDQISFLSSEGVLFHEGVEQSSWNTVVFVFAPHKYEAVEAQVADYLLRTLPTFTIHVEVEFHYYHDHSHYEKINEAYPRFITANQVHDITTDNGEEDDGCDDADCHDHNHGHEEGEPGEEGGEEIYLGNAFEGFEERLEAAQRKGEKK